MAHQIETHGRSAAALFAQQARNAIDAVLAGGGTLDELAYELDYPGGADQLDGPHIDQQIAQLPAPLSAPLSAAEAAIADAHQAVAQLSEPTAGPATDHAWAIEPDDWTRVDGRSDAVADDDADGWP